MSNLKHVGRIKTTGRKCLVVFRTLPGDAFNCLVVPTESLPASYHDALINTVDSAASQNAFEFAEVLARAVFPDGSTMLPSLASKNMMVRVPTDQVEMIPNNQTRISLAELNQIIAQQRGVSVQDLAIKDSPSKNVEVQNIAQAQRGFDEVPQLIAEEPLSDAALAAKYRADAAALLKEAASLTEMANSLAPVAPPVIKDVVAQPAEQPVVTEQVSVPVERTKAPGIRKNAKVKVD